MSYKKYVKTLSLPNARLGIKTNGTDEDPVSSYNRVKNLLPIIYQGPQNRIERYTIYDNMMKDPIINWSLDMITDFVIQMDKDEIFVIDYDTKEKLTESQTSVLDVCLKNWVNLNEWKKRIFPTVRELLKYGDIFFIQDPETLEIRKINIYDVVGIGLDDEKKPLYYIIKNVALNIPLNMTTVLNDEIRTNPNLQNIDSAFPVSNVNKNLVQYGNSSINDDNSRIPVSAEHIIHISLNLDNIVSYPFGNSILDDIYKIYSQKMLVQDCVLLHRISNATERLVFNIPVGQIPRYKRRQYLEKMKNEQHQRRMPAKDSEGVFNTLDVTYNAVPMTENYYLPVDIDGVQPKIDKLAASNQLGDINDMVYWENLLIRGLKVPQSWIPYGPTDGQRTMPTNMSNVYVQELRFFKYCCRLQEIIIPELDQSFKNYVKHKGVSIDDSYRIMFNKPSNITEITEEEIQSKRLETFGTAISNPYISKKYAMQKYLKMSDSEYNENIRLLIQENEHKLKDVNVDLPTEDKDVIPGLRSVDIRSIPDDYINDIQNDMNIGFGGAGGMGSDVGDMGGMGGMDMGDNLTEPQMDMNTPTNNQ